MPRPGKTKSPAAVLRRRPGKDSRLEARVTAEQKALIERAAAYEGRTVSDFLLHSAQQAAKAVIQEHEVLTLNRSQSRALVELLLDAPPPNKTLQRALHDHRRQVTSR
jgi:uncharacterized protein (DUF1778 family)